MKTLISHYDLDGVSSAIVLDRIFKFDVILKGGYHRSQEMVNKVESGASVIVSDFVLSTDEYRKLKDKTLGKLIVLDHHPETRKLKNLYPKDPIYYNPDKSATLICIEELTRRNAIFSDEIRELGRYANAFDLYQRGSEDFKVGYDLNLLFWKLHFDDFLLRFQDGFDGFNENELMYIKKIKDEYAQVLAESTYGEYLGDNIQSLICVCSEPAVINEVPYYKPGYDIYFILNRYKNSFSLSLRTAKQDPINTYCKEIEKEPGVISAGGHPQACGITLDPKISDERALEIVIKYHEMVDRAKQV